MSQLVAYKKEEEDEKKEEIDWISILPVELLVHIIRHLPPQYLYSLHRWMNAERAEMVKTSSVVRARESRNRWSFVNVRHNFLHTNGSGSYDQLPSPGYFNYKNLLHLSSLLLADNCLSTNKLRMFNRRLFLSGVDFISELSTTKRAREEEYGQRFDVSEDPSDVENLLRVDRINCNQVIYTVADNGSVYYYEDLSKKIVKFDGKVKTTLDPPLDDVLSIIVVGSNLYVARTNGSIDVWENDKHLGTFEVSLSVKSMCVHRDWIYIITDDGECRMSDLSMVKQIDLNQLEFYYRREWPFDMCVHGDHMYLYYEYEHEGWRAAIFDYNISTTYVQSEEHLKFNKYHPTNFTPNMHVSGHYLCVTTSQNTLVIADLRDFSLKTIEEPLIYSAVLGDDYSLYANCRERDDSSSVVKFYW